MSIDVYWTMCPFTVAGGYRVEDPVNIKNKFLSTYNGGKSYGKCPSVVDYLNNLYGLKQIYDANLTFDLNEPKITADDQESMDLLLIRSLEDNLFSWKLQYTFFTEEESLTMEVLPAYLEDNDVANKTIMIPGSVDIGKWFRPMDFAWHFKDQHKKCNLNFNRNDIITYIHFKTSEKINLKYFHMTSDLELLTDQVMATKYKKSWGGGVEWFYNVFSRRKLKSRFLKQIKQNIA